MVKRKEQGADKNWWTKWPKILEDELAAFVRQGIAVSPVHQENGILIYEADWPVLDQTEPLHLRIGFSSLHPFFRPAVTATDRKFERHQNPLTGELCLLTQETGQWDSKQLVADFIQERLEQLLLTLAARSQGRWDDAARLEEQAADPLMPYFAGLAEKDSVFLFDGQMKLPGFGHGLMEFAYTSRPTNKNPSAFEGVLKLLQSGHGARVGKRFDFPNDPPSEKVIIGRWVKFSPPLEDNPEELLRLAEEELGRQAVLHQKSVKKINNTVGGTLSVTGIVFPDEDEYGPSKDGVGWLFLVTRRELLNGEPGVAETRLVLGERAGTEDIFSRLPIASSLLNKTVLVVGCGAIGSFAGLELARAGVGKINFLDYDTVQPGNSLRWPLGRPAWGCSKAVVLAQFVATNYPWTKAGVLDGSIGSAMAAPPPPGELKGNVLTHLLNAVGEADVVVDASASIEVQHALAHYCRELGVPYVMGYATYGVAGGVVARFLPTSESCLVCLYEHWNHDQTVPKPREDLGGVVIPVGCNAPTFTGGSFDLQEVSLEIVRTTIGLLSDKMYDPGNWDVAVLTLKGDKGERVLPSWQAVKCEPYSGCCGAGS